MKFAIFFASIALLGATAIAVAQNTQSAHDGAMDHGTPGQEQPMASIPLTEPGQGAFAALAEVVQVLEADPDTDWSRVDLAGLRAHLVDMDRLISDAVVTETELSDGIVATATGDAETAATLRRMLAAHAVQLAMDDRWVVAANETVDGMELRVTSDDPDVVARVRGLGFFGLMASQDHHREHHLMIARGGAVHGEQ